MIREHFIYKNLLGLGSVLLGLLRIVLCVVPVIAFILIDYDNVEEGSYDSPPSFEIILLIISIIMHTLYFVAGLFWLIATASNGG